ncbi:MAG: DUF4625 domain-containing protein [Bacteroidales bacterium]|nr:DUF4625 domain-containing protein [Bacteroidales bacterium]
MKSIKYQIIALFFISVLSLGFVACDKDDDSTAKPVITLTEVGHENSKTATAGDDMHLEADIVAEGLIARIDIEIHLEEGGNYEIELSYTDGKYIGVRNIEFHEHIDIPADAPAGEYHMHFTVTDKEGQQTTAESELEIAGQEE